mgnify:CR=1 FL=1
MVYLVEPMLHCNIEYRRDQATLVEGGPPPLVVDQTGVWIMAALRGSAGLMLAIKLLFGAVLDPRLDGQGQES